MANSVDLDPEWGSIDLLEEVEATFGIEISDEEARRCCTVGDLYEIVSAHTPDWDSQCGSCGSSMVFYRVRRSLSADNRRGVTPDTLLTANGLKPSRLFKKIAQDTGLRLPACELTWLGVAAGSLLVGGVLAAIVAVFKGHWMVSGFIALIALGGLAMLRLDPGRLPAGVLTVGDLVGRIVPLNVAAVKNAGARPVDRWSILTALVAEHGTLSPDEIGPETFFHRRSLESATSR